MRTRSHLPFVGLIALAATVAMLGGVGKVDKRERVKSGARPVSVPTIDVAGPTADIVKDVAIATTAATEIVAPTSITSVEAVAPVLAPRLGPAEPRIEAVGDDGVADRTVAATTTLDSGWLPATKIKGSSGNVTKCGSTFSGSTDAAGLIYHACGRGIHIRGAKGALRDVVQPDEPAPIGRRDVAANPAGTLIYYTVGDREDTGLTATQLAAGWGSVHRMKLNAKGVWKRDAWTAGPFKLYGGAPWSARYLTVGTDGIVYTSVNAFIFAIDQQGRIRADENGQYTATGARIGGPIAGYDAVAPAAGFNVVEGLAMSPDGSFLYATEEDYDYVARFARAANGAWAVDRIAATPKAAGCTTTTLAAPYDLATSKAGDVYVANTTCGEIRRYDAGLTYKGSVLKIAGMLPHGLAMAGNGAFILPWRNEIYARR